MTSHIFSQFDYWKECAEEGNTQAQYNLGLMYYNGEEVTQDYSEALKWLRKAAEDGLAKAQFMLGVMYENGFGVDKNDTAAVSWYLKAAEQGHTEAEKCCAKLAEHNANVQSQLKAYKQQKLAEMQRRKHVKEQRKRAEELYYSGLSYLNGENVTQDYPEAIRCFSEAASLGHPKAKQKLAEAIQKLKHAEVQQQSAKKQRKCAKAKQQKRTSAQQRCTEEKREHAEMQYRIGRYYLRGEVLSKDINEAIKWFRKAAKNGNSDAQSALIRRGETW